jgi:hypothetical protein
MAAGIALLLLANYLVILHVQGALSRAAATIDQTFSIVALSICAVVSCAVIVLEVRDYLRPGRWRWRRAIVWLALFACAVVIGVIQQVVGAISPSACVSNQQAFHQSCQAIGIAGACVTVALPIVGLSLLARYLPGANRSDDSSP